MKLVDVKTGKVLTNLPNLEFYSQEYAKIDVGLDVLKKFYRKKDLNQIYIGLSELKRMCLDITELRIGNLRRMFKGQTYYYKLAYENEGLKSGQIILPECPNKIRIRFDILNGENGRGRVRLEGRGTGYKEDGYKGSWHDVF